VSISNPTIAEHCNYFRHALQPVVQLASTDGKVVTCIEPFALHLFQGHFIANQHRELLLRLNQHHVHGTLRKSQLSAVKGTVTNTNVLCLIFLVSPSLAG